MTLDARIGGALQMRHHRDPAERRQLTIQIASLITGGFMEAAVAGGGVVEPATPHDLPTRTLTLETGPELHYFLFGDGHPVIFVHGSFADYRAWFGQLGAFGDRFKALTYSRRHHYPNRWNTDGRSSCTRLHAEDLACLIRRLNLAPATVVGKSSGGLVAMHAAAVHPELVHSLVLSEPFVPDMLDEIEGGAAAWAAYETRYWLPAGRAFAEGRTERGVELLCDAIFGDGAFPAFSADIRPLVMQNAPEMHLEFSNSGYFSSFTAQDVARIHAPVMLAEGDASPVMYRLIAEALARAMPTAKRVLFPDVSHVPPFLAMDEFNARAIAFIEDHLP